MQMHTESSSEIKTFPGAHRGTSKPEMMVVLNHLSVSLDPWASWRTNNWTFTMLGASVQWKATACAL